MIDYLQRYHNQLRASGGSGYPNMSYYNPQHQQSPYPLAGDPNQYGSPEMYYNPYDRLNQVRSKRTYQQRPQSSLWLSQRYGGQPKSLHGYPVHS